MRVEQFGATRDLVGRRVRLSWSYVPLNGETLADAPRVVLRRKLRDFEFPAGAGGEYVVYDSAAFPPAPAPGLSVRDLQSQEAREGAVITRTDTVSVAREVAGQSLETVRVEVATELGADGFPRSQRLELLDTGASIGELLPLTPYYYALTVYSLSGEETVHSACVTSGEVYGLNRKLYDLLPEVYRRHDTIVRPDSPDNGVIPETSGRVGQLRRFVDMFGLSLDSLRASAEGLLQLRDVWNVEPRFLPLIAQWLGWGLDHELPVSQQRTELANATRLYRSVGAVPSLRAIVNHYTGWTCRVAELAENVARANVVTRWGLFAAVKAAAELLSPDDASASLGFGPANRDATGSLGVSAVLVGSATEPFALRVGDELSIEVDERVVGTVRFSSADFATFSAASAAEVAAVLNRTFDELAADSVAGQLRLSSSSTGDGSALKVISKPRSFLTSSAALPARTSAVADVVDSVRLFFCGEGLGSEEILPPRLAYKTFVAGAFRGARYVDAAPRVAEGHPCAVPAGGGSLHLFSLAEPATARASLRFRVGKSLGPKPARLLGGKRQPFRLAVGARLTFDAGGVPQVFNVLATDYANPAQSSAAEVAIALNSQLTRVAASVAADGSLIFSSQAAGPEASLRIDMAQSNLAHVLGFGAAREAALGSWDDALSFEPVQEITSLPRGRHGGLACVRDPGGGTLVCVSTHQQRAFRLSILRVDGTFELCTPLGAASSATGAGFIVVDQASGLPSNEVRAVCKHPLGFSFFATDAGLGVRDAAGAFSSWSVASTGGGLASDDVRSVSLGADGALWVGHALGVSRREPSGAWTQLAGLATTDVRDTFVDDGGALWIATSAGLHRLVGTSLSWFRTNEGLPSNDVRQITGAGSSAVWVATLGGVGKVDAAGRVTSWGTAEGIPTGGARALCVDRASTLWVATPAGLVERRGDGFVLHGVADGLPSLDVLALRAAPDGGIWIGTSAGLCVRDFLGAMRRFTTSDGLPDDRVTAIAAPSTSPLVFASGSGGDVEPACVLDASNRVWLVWSERLGVGTVEDVWLLRGRRLSWGDPSFGAAFDVTSVPASGVAQDREASLTPRADLGVDVYFSSNRGDGTSLFRLTIDDGMVASAPVLLGGGAAIDRAPRRVDLPGRGAVLLFASDTHTAVSELPRLEDDTARHAAITSHRVSESATVKYWAGKSTPVLSHRSRNDRHLRFGDYQVYTPQRPSYSREGPPQASELYTPSTLGLFVSRPATGRPLTARDAQRLRQLLERFLPINRRAVIILSPSSPFEIVYGPGADIGESFLDQYPFAENLGEIGEFSSAALRDWSTLLATDGASRSVLLTDLSTLQRRTWRPRIE